MSAPELRGVHAERARLLLWAIVVGLAGGAAALALRAAATLLPLLVWPRAPDLVRAVALATPAQRLLVPLAGALLAGAVLLIGERWTAGARGWDILEAVVLRDGVLPVRPTLVRTLSSLLTVASGGPVGREGPIVLLSSTVASVLGRWRGLPTRQRRVLVGCGAATGLACAYNTPIGASLFTLEILFGSLALDAFLPIAVSAATATLLTRAVFGEAPVFGVPALALTSVWEIVPHATLGLLAGLLAAAFLLALRLSAALFRRLAWPRPLAMAVPALALAAVIGRYPELVGNGREAIAELFTRNWAVGPVLALLGLRMALTPLTVGAGAVGGVFTPTLFLGAMLGYAFGAFAHGLLPGATAAPGAYALVGMGALLAGTTHAPLTAVLMVFEMTLDYNLVVPLLVASAAASLVATGLSRDSVYTEALSRLAADGGGRPAIGRLRARDLMRPEQVNVPPDLSLVELLERFVDVRRNHLYVVDAAGRFLGAINLHDVNRELRDGRDPRATRAVDLVRPSFETTTPDEPLDRVLERFARQDCERLPVLEALGVPRLLGTLSKRDVLSVYSLELLQQGASARRTFSPEGPADGEVEELDVPAEAVGRTVEQAGLREHYGLSVLLLRRSTGSWLLPGRDTCLTEGDRLIVLRPRRGSGGVRSPLAPENRP